MPSAKYLWRQADLCLRLSLISTDDEISNRLILMAKDYEARATALEASTPPAEATVRTDLSDREQP
jgi:hypothetical protein